MNAPDLVLRYSASEHALRSTGELAGVVVIARLGGTPTLAVDSAYDPELYPLPTGTTLATLHEDGLAPTSRPIETADAVAACIGDDELRHLYALVSQGFRDGLAVLLAAQSFEAIRELVDFVEDVARLIEERLGA